MFNNPFLDNLFGVAPEKKKKGEPSWRKYYRPPGPGYFNPIKYPTEVPWKEQTPWTGGGYGSDDPTGEGGGKAGGQGGPGGGFQMQGSYSGTEPRDAYVAGGKFMGGMPPIGLMLDGKMHFPGMGGGAPAPTPPPDINTPGQPGMKPPMTGNPMIPGGQLPPGFTMPGSPQPPAGPTGPLQPPTGPGGPQPAQLQQLLKLLYGQ